MPIRIQFALILLCFLASFCAKKNLPIKDDTAPKTGQNLPEVPTKPAVMADENEGNDSKTTLVLSLAKSPCYGKCPVFEAQVFSDGTAEWKGVKYVERVGKYKAKMPDHLLKQVLEQAESSGYFDLAAHYPYNAKNIADFPITTSFVKSGKKERRIENNFDAPLKLQEFENFLFKKLDALDWKVGQ